MAASYTPLVHTGSATLVGNKCSILDRGRQLSSIVVALRLPAVILPLRTTRLGPGDGCVDGCSLDSAGVLKELAVWLDSSFGSAELIAGAIGLASAVVDNVPLVAATMGMYDLDQVLYCTLLPCAVRNWTLVLFPVRYLSPDLAAGACVRPHAQSRQVLPALA